MKKLGCHLSEKNGFVAMAKEAVDMGANTFQFFTRNPRGGHTREWEQADLQAYREFAQKHELGPIVAYAPYTANPASEEMTQQDFAQMVFAEDLARMQQLPVQYYAVHLGSAIGEPQEDGLQQVVSALNAVITPAQETTMLIINSAGKGTEVGSTFEEVEQILRGLNFGGQAGVLFDICAAWAAGYDVKGDLNGVLQQFDDAIGLDKMKAVHLADPEYPLGDHNDRHAPLGKGQLGQDTLSAVFGHPDLSDKVFILETPHDDMQVFAKEIELLRG